MEQNLTTSTNTVRDIVHTVTITAFDPETGVGIVKPIEGPELVVPSVLIENFGKNKFTVGKQITCKHLGPGTHVTWISD